MELKAGVNSRRHGFRITRNSALLKLLLDCFEKARREASLGFLRGSTHLALKNSTSGTSCSTTRTACACRASSCLVLAVTSLNPKPSASCTHHPVQPLCGHSIATPYGQNSPLCSILYSTALPHVCVRACWGGPDRI